MRKSSNCRYSLTEARFHPSEVIRFTGPKWFPSYCTAFRKFQSEGLCDGGWWWYRPCHSFLQDNIYRSVLPFLVTVQLPGPKALRKIWEKLKRWIKHFEFRGHKIWFRQSLAFFILRLLQNPCKIFLQTSEALLINLTPAFSTFSRSLKSFKIFFLLQVGILWVIKANLLGRGSNVVAGRVSSWLRGAGFISYHLKTFFRDNWPW